MVNELSVAFDREIFLVQQFGGVSKSFVKNIEIMEKRRDLGLKPQLTFTRTTNRHLIESNAICASDLNPARRFFQYFPEDIIPMVLPTLDMQPITGLSSMILGRLDA